MNRPYPILIALILLVEVHIPCMAQGAIVISDGPNSSVAPAAPAHRPTIVTTDGPPVLSYQYPPKIITSDGPQTLAYQYPPKLEVTSGPTKPFYESSANPSKVVVSDGPNTSRVVSIQGTAHAQLFPPASHTAFILDGPDRVKKLHRHAAKTMIAKTESKPLLDPSVSTLAPVIQTKNSSRTMPNKIALALGALSLLTFLSFKSYQRWARSD